MNRWKALMLLGAAILLPLIFGWALQEKRRPAPESPHPDRVGPDQAVISAHPDGGFVLSDPAARTIGLRVVPVTRSGPLLLPREAIVYSRVRTDVYRLRDGWLKLVPGRIEDRTGGSLFIPDKPDEIRPGDRVVSSGAPLLRVTDIHLSSADNESGE